MCVSVCLCVLERGLNNVVGCDIILLLYSQNYSILTHAAQTMVDLAKDKRTLDGFAVNMHAQLGEFEFPDEFISDVWTSIQTAKTVAASKAAAKTS